MEAAELLASYRERAVLWQEMTLFPPQLALEFLRDCAANQIRILGFESFDPPVGETIRLRSGDELDLSTRDYWDYSVEELCEVAGDAIRACEAPVLYEFALD